MNIQKLLNIKYPIFQGAMANIATAEFVAAVSNAGALGILATGSMTPDIAREEIKACKEKTDQPFGVNIMLMNPYSKEIIDIVCEEGVAVVTTGAGNPGPYIEQLKAHNIKVIPVIPSVALGKRMERLGVDAVIAEGGESGGHVGETTTMALLPQVVDALSIPVIAAGGIGDGRGMLAAEVLGASGIQIGTSLLVANECPIHENYKKIVLKAKDTDTIVTGRQANTPVRVYKNQMAKQYVSLESSLTDREELEKLTLGSLKKAVVLGDIKEGSFMIGQIAGMIKEEKSLQEILDTYMKDYTESKKKLLQGVL